MLRALQGSPLDPVEYVCLADDSIDEAAMGEPQHEPALEFDLPAGNRATWTRMLEYLVTRDTSVLVFRSGMRACRWRLRRLTLAQAQAVRDASGEFERAMLAVRYALLAVDAYEIAPGELLRVERERGPQGEWTSYGTMERIAPAHILELAAAVQVRSGLTPPFRPTLRSRSASGQGPSSADLSTPSGA